MAAIETRDVRKTYANGVEALKGVDVEVEEGEIFCLLGPNGAGKTTLVRILGTQLVPSGGTIRILGHDLETGLTAIRRQLSIIPQSSWPDPMVKVWEMIYYYLCSRGLRRAEARRLTKEITEQLRLADKYDHTINELSGGMRRRVLLAMALAAPSKLMLLDEPTTRLDVLIRRETWRMLSSYKADKTILLTTHSMEEAEALSERLAIVSQGKVVAVGTAAELRQLAPSPRKMVIDEEALPRDELARYGTLQTYANKWAVYPRDDEALRAMLDYAIARDVESSVLNATLEDAFVHLVGDTYQLKHGELR